MEISVEHVTEKFKLYSGETFDGAEPSRDALCLALCKECTAWVKRRVRRGAFGEPGNEDAAKSGGQIEPDRDGGTGDEAQPETSQEDAEKLDALESLAASEAFWQLAVLDQAAVPQTVSSSEIKIQLGDRAGSARRLRDEKIAACRGLLLEDGFYFGLT